MPQHHTTLTGAAGELFVMYRLSRMGYIAALAPKGAPNADIIITDTEGSSVAVIQVKTRNNLGTDGGWSMRKKHEEITSNNLFYCFVDLGDDESSLPTTYIVPSAVVAEAASQSHQIWLDTPGRDGRPHVDNDLRRFVPDYLAQLHVDNAFTRTHSVGWLDIYKEQWEILSHP